MPTGCVAVSPDAIIGVPAISQTRRSARRSASRSIGSFARRVKSKHGGAVGSARAARAIRIDSGPRPERTIVAGMTVRSVAETYCKTWCGCRVPPANRRHTADLRFIEPLPSTGAIVGRDIAAVAGGPLKSGTWWIVVQMTDHQFDLQCLPIRGQAIVSGIETVR